MRKQRTKDARRNSRYAFYKPSRELKRIKRNDRLDILKQCVDWIANQQEISLITVVAAKHGKTKDPILESSWQKLIQRFESTMRYRNFKRPANPDDRGILLDDQTDVNTCVRWCVGCGAITRFRILPVAIAT